MPFGEKLYVNTHLKHHVIACLLSSVKYSPLYRNKNVKISVQLSVWFSTGRRIYATYVDINITDINFAILKINEILIDYKFFNKNIFNFIDKIYKHWLLIFDIYQTANIISQIK